MKEKINVFLRVRPLNDSELKMSSEVKYNIMENQVLIEEEFENKRFYFDYCFQPNVSARNDISSNFKKNY